MGSDCMNAFDHRRHSCREGGFTVYGQAMPDQKLCLHRARPHAGDHRAARDAPRRSRPGGGRRRLPDRLARLRPARGRRVRAANQPARRRAAGDAFARGRGPPSARAGRGGGVGDPPARPRHGRADHRPVAQRGRGPARGGAPRRRPQIVTAGAEAAASSELDAETDRIWAERHRIVEDARELAQAAADAGRLGGRALPGRSRGAMPADGTAAERATSRSDARVRRRATARRSRTTSRSTDEVQPEDDLRRASPTHDVDADRRAPGRASRPKTTTPAALGSRSRRCG